MLGISVHSDEVKASYMPITVDFSRYAATESAAKIVSSKLHPVLFRWCWIWVA